MLSIIMYGSGVLNTRPADKFYAAWRTHLAIYYVNLCDEKLLPHRPVSAILLTTLFQ
jgi:hypothetical protein